MMEKRNESNIISWCDYIEQRRNREFFLKLNIER